MTSNLPSRDDDVNSALDVKNGRLAQKAIAQNHHLKQGTHRDHNGVVVVEIRAMAPSVAGRTAVS